ncbi:MAG: YceI family protein [Pseudomonadota bacterium]
MALSTAARAAPVSYALDAERSTVGFTYRLLGSDTAGTMPVAAASIMIDFQSLARTSADVTLAANRARAGVVFATEAMRSASVLDTARHPTIRFRSTRTRGTSRGAQMDGSLTIRGVTRPVTLSARFLEPPGSNATTRDRLSIELTGSVLRSAFGATGYPDLVDDRIDIRIRARLRRVS